MVTGRCNFACFFCHMEGYKQGYRVEDEVSLEEIELLAKAAKRIGIEAFKITGGEPTVRSDLVDIVKILHSYGFYVSMTTNASLLHNHMPGLADAGIGHVNVSLHSLSENVFEKITGRRMLGQVIQNIRLLREYGIPVKINFVVLRGLNEDDVVKLIDFAASVDATVQIIELHPVGRAVKRFKDYYLPRWHILEKLEDRVVEIKYRVGLHNRPILVLDNGVRVELVGPVGNYAFCAACTRMRVTYDFKLIPCLNWRGSPIDIRKRLVNTHSPEEKVEKIIEALKEANMLRRPFVLFPRSGKPFTVKRKWRIARLGIPRRDGSLSITGQRREKVLALLLGEWGKYLQAS
ncbi:Molybdenum cofactor biosynthesis enzyme [Hyperthermus butylicus DSM 5456]|uniref:Molybdenum cofactor biosynthesis enzyme n=2 Tax=Hyperthermus butylicus TaxID=54248 RepID=A2BM24_HYPBU|nr:Molybdenum cofactor biosynthesis enzyme [Hyperthermus butylicus DSM 5456]